MCISDGYQKGQHSAELKCIKIKDQINKYGITDKEKQKRINSQMSDARMHVTDAWNSMRKSKEFIEKNKD